MGITSICGENGAGKSSILEAISWVLFNFLPYSASSRIIRNGTKSAEVELKVQSSIDGEEYILKRKTQGQTNVFSLKNKSLITEGVGNLQQWVRHQLGLRQSDNLSSICRNGIATPQGSLSLDFLESTENRRRIFDVILGLDEYKIVHNSLGEVLKIINEKSNDLKINLAKSDFAEEELNKVNDEVQSKRKEQLDLKIQVGKLENEINQLSSSLKTAENAKAKFEEINKDIERDNENLRLIQAELTSLLERENEKKSLDNSSEEYQKLKNKKKVLIEQKKEFDVLTTRKIQLDETLKLENENIEKTKIEIKKLHRIKEEFKSIENSVKNYEVLTLKEKELSKQKSQIEAELPFKQKFQDDILNITKEIEQLSEQINDVQLKIPWIQTLEQLERKLDDKRTEFNEVSRLEKQKKEIENDSVFKTEKQNWSIEEIIQELNKKEAQVLENESKKNKLEAQFEVNKKLLPELFESIKCPLLDETCKNLSGKIHELSSQERIYVQEESLKTQITEILDLLSNNKLELDHFKIVHQKLLDLGEVNKQLVGRSSQDLILEGKELKIKVEELRRYKLLLDNLPQTQKQLDKFFQEKSNLQLRLIELTHKENSFIEINKELKNISEDLQNLKPIAEKALVLKSEIQKEDIFQSVLNEQSLKIDNLNKQLGSTNDNLQNLVSVPEELNKTESNLESLEPIFIKWSQLAKEIEVIPELQIKKESLDKKLEDEKCLLNVIKEKLKDESWISQNSELLQEKQKEFNKFAGLLHSITYLLKEKEERQKELTQIQSEMIKQKDELQRFKYNEQKTSKMRGYFKELSIQMAKRYTKKISGKSTNMFREIMQDASYEIEWTEDYEILMYKNGQKLSFENLSGGQQTAASIAVRLGLLQELSNIRFAFFDEPTAHLDVERRNQLAMQISSIKSFDQLFVITHDESFASQANNIIQVGNN